MASLQENISRAIDSFDAIKEAIEGKGVPVGDAPTSEYGSKIAAIKSGGGIDYKPIAPYGVKSFFVTAPVTKQLSYHVGGEATFHKVAIPGGVYDFCVTSPVSVLLNSIFIQEV